MSTLASSPKYAGIARTYAEIAIWITPLLLVANLIICIDLVMHRTASASPREPDQIIAQADKLFQIMKDLCGQAAPFSVGDPGYAAD